MAIKKFLSITLLSILTITIILSGAACDTISNNNIVRNLWNRVFSGDKIAYASGIYGERDIYIMNIDGSGQTQLTDNNADNTSPCFSPDGSKIAFMSIRDGKSEIYIMNADGSEQMQLTENLVNDSLPCFSPDGTKIAFMSDRDGNGEIYIMNVDGSEQLRITDNPAADTSPSFSPDGNKICFMSDRDREKRRFEVYIMNSDGSNQTRLTYDDSNWVDSPCFSPDGTRIAFIGAEGIYTIEINSLDLERITGDIPNDSYKRLSPDWSKIVVIREGEPDEYGPGILVFTLDAYNQEGDLDKAALTRFTVYGVSPCFSP